MYREVSFKISLDRFTTTLFLYELQIFPCQFPLLIVIGIYAKIPNQKAQGHNIQFLD